MTRTWFTSDLHFKHRNIVALSDRSVATTKEDHDEWLIDLWNSQVQPGDLVYHMGDFCFHSKEAEWESILSRLNGQKIMIKGNHDSSRSLRHSLEKNLIAAWYDYREIKIDDIPIALFHFPISSWHRQNYGSFHLHGHCHGRHQQPMGKMLDVGLDSAYNILGKHQFFTWEFIKEYMQSKDLYIADFHRTDYTEVKK